MADFMSCFGRWLKSFGYFQIGSAFGIQTESTRVCTRQLQTRVTFRTYTVKAGIISWQGYKFRCKISTIYEMCKIKSTESVSINNNSIRVQEIWIVTALFSSFPSLPSPENLAVNNALLRLFVRCCLNGNGKFFCFFHHRRRLLEDRSFRATPLKLWGHQRSPNLCS